MDIPEDLFSAAESESDAIMAMPGVTHWDVGVLEQEGELTEDYGIRVYVSDLAAYGDELPSEINGYPTCLIEEEFALDADTARYDPLVAGCEIENGDSYDSLGTSGTLGLIARGLDGDRLFGVTNAHVLCTGDYKVGNQVCQPARTSGGPPAPSNVIGLLYDWSFEHDCAVFEIPQSISPLLEVLQIGTVTGSRPVPEIDPQRLPEVRKRGRTTGLKYGRVIGRNRLAVTDQSGSTTPPCMTIRLDVAYSSIPWSQGGDSGAAIVDSANYVVGLHFARADTTGRYGLAIPWQDVRDSLSVEVAT